MWISVKEYVIEKREFHLETEACQSGKVSLELRRKDIKAIFFLFPKKTVQLICKDTGENINKSQWSPEIKAAALGMKSNYTTPTWGYWSFGFMVLSILVIVIIGNLIR